MEKIRLTLNVDREVVKQTRIAMAKLELTNQSQFIENLLKEWVAKQQQQSNS